MQLSMLSRAAQSDAGAWWWIKGDRVDVVRGIGKLMREEWWDLESCVCYIKDVLIMQHDCC